MNKTKIFVLVFLNIFLTTILTVSASTNWNIWDLFKNLSSDIDWYDYNVPWATTSGYRIDGRNVITAFGKKGATFWVWNTATSWNVWIWTSTPSQKLEVVWNIITSWNLYRSDHNEWWLVGGYNNVWANSNMTSPIYSIWSNYLPSNTTLSNHYWVGYTHATNASFVPVSGGWWMYVSADGDARIFLDWSYWRIRSPNWVKTDCIWNCF